MNFLAVHKKTWVSLIQFLLFIWILFFCLPLQIWYRYKRTYLYNLLFCMLSGAFGVNFPLRRYPVTVTMVVASVCAQCIDTDCQRSGDTSGESTDHWYPPSYSWPPTPPAPTQLPRVSGIWKAAPHTIVPPSHTLDHKELLLFNQIVLCYLTTIDFAQQWCS